MSPYSGEEEALDLFYLEIEERILLLISEEEEEEDGVKKTRSTAELPSDKNSSFLDSSWYSNSYIDYLQPTKQGRRGCYGSENIGKKNKPWNNGGKRVPDIGGRKGTGVFLPRSRAHRCS
ncbi:hypothetical protein MA16_Dca007453 [Dendrobium catenatum]|uniref:Uncharacterized protein n=1 Tax=Dendrobium catenatum TaxID=906689 RepID=A0A2I0WAP6_9ASPA|nr:hypothetical protein MA16_Dca007453 [Dendrobium catenatum]